MWMQEQSLWMMEVQIMKVYQIKVNFHVTEQIERYVYVYLIVGKHCYLIDSGVAGCQQIIIDKMNEIGKEMSDLKAIFLTHAHPDHIGTAAWFKDQTGCKIYASKREKTWIEDVDLQFRERPIPNFYTLAGKSVMVDNCIKDGDTIELDETFSIEVIGTAGHSIDEVSYKVEDSLFIGDSIPVKGDIPIYVDCEASVRSLKRISKESNCKWFYPAWDFTYDSAMIYVKINEALELIEGIESVVKIANQETNIKELVKQICELLEKPELSSNPLFVKTVMSHLKHIDKEFNMANSYQIIDRVFG